MPNFFEIFFVVVAAIIFFACKKVEACTTILVTKGASKDDSVFVAHSNDGFQGDPNVVYVPAKNHETGSLRPVYPSTVAAGELPDYNCFFSPHLVAPERGDGYKFFGKPSTKPIGFIPEVEHTYAYLDANYPVMNEHGLMMGECSDTSKRLPEISCKEGVGIFYSSELGRVALERCKTAREAIKLMGKLIDEFGLYGTAETLFVADRDEGWLFEMMPTPSGKGGFWIAEKIPDGNFSIAANQLRIQAIRESDPNQIFNPKLPQMLEEVGWAVYDAAGNLNWIKSLQGGEPVHPYFSLRRVWRAFDLVAPSKNLSTKVESSDSDYYPLSIKSDKKLAVEDVMNLYRDYLEGTEFDKTRSAFAGLHAAPYDCAEDSTERSILNIKTCFVQVAQVNDKLPAPICWLATNTAAENPFVPFAVAKMPAAYNHALRKKYDASKMFWVSNQIMSLTRGYWNSFSPTVAEAVRSSEEKSLRLVMSSINLDKEKFAARLNRNAVKVVNDWKKLYEKLLVKYNGGAGVCCEANHLPKPDAPTKY